MNIHVITHTHWDREWYLSAGRFRQRLVALIDEMLDPREGAETPFLLDGQAVILEDYLSVRPEQRAALVRRLRDASLEAGPWYVLADELIPSGEALVRNLLAGRRVLATLDAAPPPVLYCPDSFGHPAALPMLAAGFGCELIILWRGLGGPLWPSGDSFCWAAPDGSEALVHHLPRDGYEYGANLPKDAEALRARWKTLADELKARTRLGVLLVLNGADHHALQTDLEAALVTLRHVAAPDRVVRTGLRGFAAEVLDLSENHPLPRIEGELRSSYGYTWSLQGTFATRAMLKRRNATVERTLLREAEPWSAIAARAGAPSRRHIVNAAWKTLLLCHPHDTLCACSTDEVARAMEARLDDAESQAHGVRDDALLDVVQYDPAMARTTATDRRTPVVLVRNPAARKRGGVADLEVLTFRQHVPVGPSSARSYDERASSAQSWWLDEGRVPVQFLSRSMRHDRVESPRHYPSDDLVDVARIVAWMEPIEGYGIRALPITNSAVPNERSCPRVTAGAYWLENESIRIEVDSGGVVSLHALRTGQSIQSLLGFDDIGDAGDLYTHSPINPRISEKDFIGAELLHSGPLRGEIAATYRVDLPAISDREGRNSTLIPHVIRVALTLDAGAPFLRITVTGTNSAKDHRLRVTIATGVGDGLTHADAAFGPVVRKEIELSPEFSVAEMPPPTAPLARYVTISNDIRGATVYSDGLAEYEAMIDGKIAITLVRAVGELSRNDLPERPGHAGWPVLTPEAQCLGGYEGRFAILPHVPRDDAMIQRIDHVADDVLLPVSGTTLRSALSVPTEVAGITLEGEGLAFSTCKESENGEWTVLRCMNLLDRKVSGRWRVSPPPSEARLARMDETPGDLISVDGGAIEFLAKARSVVTILAR